MMRIFSGDKMDYDKSTIAILALIVVLALAMVILFFSPSNSLYYICQ